MCEWLKFRPLACNAGPLSKFLFVDIHHWIFLMTVLLERNNLSISLPVSQKNGEVV